MNPLHPIEATPLDITLQSEAIPPDDSVWIQDLFGSIKTTSTVPTAVPIKFSNQIQIYSSGGTWKLYIYDTVGQVWKSVTLT